MEELPPALLDGLRPNQWGTVQQWWTGLADTDRRQVAELCDERGDACFFGVVADESAPRVFGMRFLPHDDAWQFDEWEQDWREYLCEHSDVFLLAHCQSRSYRYGDGVLSIVVDWSRTRFGGAELPPSEKAHRTT